MIAELHPQDIVSYCRSVLSIECEDPNIDDLFLTALLRRTAGVLCPCSRTTLRNSLTESLTFLHDRPEDISTRIKELIEDLIVVGDLLELSDVTIEDKEAKGTWVFASPPAFVERKNGSIFLTGIVPDHDGYLSEEMSRRVVHSYSTRLIVPEPNENLVEILIAEGLNRLSESAWLKTPKLQSAVKFLEKIRQRLAAEPPCPPIAGLEVIDPKKNPTYYRGRWVEPSNQSGMLIARRPQQFGAPMWCFAELNEGVLIRIIDLPVGTYRWRACDFAWHLQMALDCENEAPQRYRRSDLGSACRFDFYSPLPLWSERRLMVLGQRCPGEKSLFAYELPVNESGQEEEFLRENLWLEPLGQTNDGWSR